MEDFEEIFARIQSVTHTKTQTGLAKILGIRQSSISDAKSRKTVPLSWHLTLFDALGVNPHWLQHGSGPIYLRTETSGIPNNNPPDDKPDELPDYQLQAGLSVPVYSMRPRRNRRGNWKKTLPHSLPVVGRIMLPLCYAKPGIIVLFAETEAAAPTLRRGAYAGVDTRSAAPLDGKLYAVLLPREGIVMRRLVWDEKRRRFLQKAENDELMYQRSSSKCSGTLLGRVCWVLQHI